MYISDPFLILYTQVVYYNDFLPNELRPQTVTVELNLVYKERGSFRETRCDVALIGDWPTDKGNTVILVSGTQGGSHLHDEAIFHEAIHIQGKKFACGVLLSLDIERPK